MTDPKDKPDVDFDENEYDSISWGDTPEEHEDDSWDY